jgi:hypothetical protein
MVTKNKLFLLLVAVQEKREKEKEKKKKKKRRWSKNKQWFEIYYISMHVFATYFIRVEMSRRVVV